MATQIKLRRDSYQNWYDTNPLLSQGEPGYDLTNKRLKIGDGVTLWRSLAYFDVQQTDLSAYEGNIVPSADNTYNIGSPDNRWQHGFFADGSLYVGDIKLSNVDGQLVVQQVINPGLESELPVPDTPGSVTTDRLVNGVYSVALGADSALDFPTNLKIAPLSAYGSGNGTMMIQDANESIHIVAPGNDSRLLLGWSSTNGLKTATVGFNADSDALEGVKISAGSLGGTVHGWVFGADGNLQYPGGITQSRQDDTFCSAGVDTVVYTTTAQYRHAIKLFVMVEGMAPGGNGVNWDTQACDVIAVRGYANDIVHVTTYGVTYTSAAAFATFDGQWNATTNRIEITCRPVSPTNGVTVSVHAIEMNSND